MTANKLTNEFFKRSINVLNKNRIEVGHAMKGLLTLEKWESRNHGDAIHHLPPAAGVDAKKHMLEFSQYLKLTNIVIRELHYIEEHLTDAKKTKELNALQNGLIEYEKLIHEKLSELKEKS